jgi:hypothetical protein
MPLTSQMIALDYLFLLGIARDSPRHLFAFLG